MFNDKEVHQAFLAITDDLVGTKKLIHPQTWLYHKELMEACFNLGVAWAEGEMLHHVEDQNSLQFPEQAE